MSIFENQQELAKWVRDHSGHLDVAVAFWGEGALKQLGLDNAKKSCRVLLDISSGGSNPKVVKELLRLRPESVRCVNRLHAKAYIGKKEVVIGSANASANGLGAEGSEATHWCELGLSSKSEDDLSAAKAWFNALWDTSNKITPRMLADAEIKWKKRQQGRPQLSIDTTDLLKAASSDPGVFKNREIYVTVSTEKLSPSAERARKSKEKETGSPAYMFEDWSKMPVNAHLVCFIDFDGKTITRDGPGIFHTRLDKQRGPYFWIDRSSIDGFVLGPILPWRQRLEKARRAEPRRWNSNNGFVMDLGNL